MVYTEQRFLQQRDRSIDNGFHGSKSKEQTNFNTQHESPKSGLNIEGFKGSIDLQSNIYLQLQTPCPMELMSECFIFFCVIQFLITGP